MLEKQLHVDPTPKKSSSTAGIVLIIIGALFTLTIVGAIIGIPMIVFGAILVNRSEPSKPHHVEKKDSVIESTPAQVSVIKKVSAPKPSIEPSRQIADTGFETDVGMRWFSRIGIVALVIGMGFLIKYAIDMDWISHGLRILGALLIGIAVCGTGYVFSRKDQYVLLGKTLLGGGIAIVYLTIYLAYHLEEYREALGLSAIVALGALMVVVASAVVLSLLDNSQVIASGSFFLGYITVLMSSAFEMVSIVMSLLLTLGIVSVVSIKRWYVLGVLGLFGSYVLYVIWNSSGDWPVLWSSVLLISYFVAFTIQALLALYQQRWQGALMQILNGFVFFLLYYAVLVREGIEQTWLIPGGLALVYGLVYGLSKDWYDTIHLYLTLGYLTITVPMLFDAAMVSLVWSVGAVLLAISAYKKASQPLWIATYCMSGLTIFMVLFVNPWILTAFSSAMWVESTRLWVAVASIGALFIIAYLSNTTVSRLYGWLATSLVLYTIVLELLVSYTLAATVCVAVYAVLMAAVGMSWERWSHLMTHGSVLSILVVVKLVFIDSWILTGFSSQAILESTRPVAFVIGIVALLMLYRLCSEQLFARFYVWAAGSLSVWSVLLELSGDYVLWGTLVLGVLSVVVGAVFYDKARQFGHLFSISLVVKVLLYDSWSISAFSWEDPFTSRVIGALIAVVVVSVLSWRWSTDNSVVGNLYASAGVAIALVYLLLELDDIMISVGLSVLALVVLIIGIITSNRTLRVEAIVLFFIVISKVFLYDTQNVEILYCILSYMTLGILLLTVSFLYARYKSRLQRLI